MKKVLVGFVVTALVAAAGIGGYFLLKDKLPALPTGGAAQEQSSSQPASKSGSQAAASQQAASAAYNEFDVMKPVENSADILDAIDYERTQNADTIGWLYIPDTKISNSVLQSHDNVYYLRRNERKESSLYGCYFADYTCNFGDREKLSPNTVIYGHSDLTDQPEGPRFSQLYHFTDQTFAEKHPIVYFSTPQEVMAWQVFAVLYTDTGWVYNDAEVDIATLVQEARERSIYQYEVEVGAEDKILTLSTCTVKYGKEEKRQRLVLMAKLLPADTELPTQSVVASNSNPTQPNFT